MTVLSVFQNNQKSIFVLVLLLLSVALGMFIASERLDNFELTARVQVAEQTAVLSTIAETIARNGADAVTENIIRDCPVDERIRFDDLLGRLDQGLNLAQLKELDGLFSSCASFFAERKSLMVARFTREIEVYEAQVKLLDTLSPVDEYVEAQVDVWLELVAQEQTQSGLFIELVSAQRQIISALLEGKSADSQEIVDILSEVNETREAILFARQKAADQREILNTL